MAYDFAGDWGIRRRLRWAGRFLRGVAAIAQALGVPAEKVQRYLQGAAPDFTPEEQASILSNLSTLPGGWSDSTVVGDKTIYYAEYPEWTWDRIANLEPPVGAYRFKWTYNASYAGGAIRSGPVLAYPDSDPLESAADLVGDELGSLRSLQWYVNNA